MSSDLLDEGEGIYGKLVVLSRKLRASDSRQCEGACWATPAARQLGTVGRSVRCLDHAVSAQAVEMATNCCGADSQAYRQQ